jgi:hypothetical protein
VQDLDSTAQHDYRLHHISIRAGATAFHKKQNSKWGDTVVVARRNWLNGSVRATAIYVALGRIRTLAVTVLALALGACSQGRTRIDQTYFLAVPSDTNINYFRVRVHALTYLGVADFRSGWFPAEAVDTLYGDVSNKGATEAFQLKKQLREKYDAAILKATGGYLDAASDLKTPSAVLQAWLLAERRVRAVAGAETPLPVGAVEIEYNPGGGIATFHSGEKLVLVLASNPDTVIDAISVISRDVQTGATVKNLADVFRQQSANDVATTEARNESRSKSDALIADRLGTVSDLLKADPKRGDLIREIESLRILVENLR